jgi:hypothetical protein
MVIIEERNRNKLGNPERPDSGKGTDEMPPQKIIDFESGRKTLEKAWLEKEQIRARLVERSPGKLADDWLEFSLTIAMFFALLLGFYVGLIGSFRF